MLASENPDNDPEDNDLKKFMESIKPDVNKEAEQSPTKKPAKKKAAKKKTAKKKSTSKRKSSAPDLAKLLKLMEEDPEIVEYRKNVKALVAKIYEHLNCFILIGYTEDGDPVQVTTAKCHKDYDALSTALQKYVLDSMPKPPPGSSL